MVAVNPGTIASHAKWAEKFGFNFPICHDPDKHVAAAYGALNLLGGISRCVIVVNKQGKATWVKSGMPATEDILAALDAMAQ